MASASGTARPGGPAPEGGVFRLRELADCYGALGRPVASERIDAGLIHESYVAAYETSQGLVRYLHQRINTHVFGDPEALMQNIARVTAHLRRKIEASGCPGAERRTLTVVPAGDGRPYCRDQLGRYWRTYRYIEGTHTYHGVDSPRRAFEAARAFGWFADALADLPGPRLAETIPQFHHAPRRFAALAEMVASDPLGRVAQARKEIDLAFSRRPLADSMARLQAPGGIGERVVHNDTKISNVLFDAVTGGALCVVDLDTVMPGLLLHDFGDLVRSSLGEDSEAQNGAEPRGLRLPVFEALVEGYLAGTGGRVLDEEVELFPLAGRVITLELAVRFLTDYLAGDHYFRAQRPGQNLDRCRRQLHLLLRMERSEGAMARAVERVRRPGPRIGS
jgi:Ser/Thr protein kinase RdoA (MazF antagonist)